MIKQEELTKEQAQLISEVREVKKTLKQLSKNQLIALVLQQTNQALEQQNLNKFLVEKLNKLEGKKDE